MISDASLDVIKKNLAKERDYLRDRIVAEVQKFRAGMNAQPISDLTTRLNRVVVAAEEVEQERFERRVHAKAETTAPERRVG